MKRQVYKLVILFIFSTILAIFIPYGSNIGFLGSIYGVSGILFSIGISLIVTFSLQGIKTKTYIQKLRKQLKYVRNTFILYFTISTIIYILSLHITKPVKFHILIDLEFSFFVFASTSILFSVIYFIVNFISVQNLKDEVFDRLLSEDE